MTIADAVRATSATNTEELACNLRDTLLPDILAVSMLLKEVYKRVEPCDLDHETRDLLSEMQSTIEGDVREVRGLISQLLPADRQKHGPLHDLRSVN